MVDFRLIRWHKVNRKTKNYRMKVSMREVRSTRDVIFDNLTYRDFNIILHVLIVLVDTRTQRSYTIVFLLLFIAYRTTN